MATLDREEFYQALSRMETTMRDGFTGVHDRLDALNGKVNQHSVDIGVLKDRAGRDRVGIIGTAIGAAVAGAIGWFK